MAHKEGGGESGEKYKKERKNKEEKKESRRIRTFSGKRQACELFAVSKWSQEERIHEIFSKLEA